MKLILDNKNQTIEIKTYKLLFACVGCGKYLDSIDTLEDETRSIMNLHRHSICDNCFKLKFDGKVATPKVPWMND